MAIKNGEWIKVQYTGTFEDGTIFDSTERNGDPLKFQVGAGQLIKGFDDAVLGMKIGEEKNITLQPKDAYGEYQDKMTQKFPKSQFPKDHEPQPGMMIMIGGPDGMVTHATIIEVAEQEVTVDLNHPLAGKVLNFKIKIIETGCEPDPHSCGCGCGHDH